MSSSAIAPPLRRRPSMSALITRASISSVAPGRVAIRAPASVAALRAAVCESDCTVGASTTSAAAIAAATGAGGSARVRGALGHQADHAVGPRAPGLAAQPLAEPDRRRVADDQHLLALADAEAVADRPRSTARSRSLIRWTLPARARPPPAAPRRG